MVGPFLTKSADTQGDGAKGRSVRRAASRDERTTEAPGTSSSQMDEDAAQPDRVQIRPGPAVPEAPAHAPGQESPEFRLERGTWPGQGPAPNSPRRGARILARRGHRLEAAALECARAPAGTRQKPDGPPASRR